MECAIEWCDRPVRKLGYCDAHYQRHQKGRDMDAPHRNAIRPGAGPTTCSHSGCSAKHYSARLCQFHYHRAYKGQDLDAPRHRSTPVPGVTKRLTGHGYVHLWLPDHPAAFGRGWVIEHRYAMEQKLGRLLLPHETVHHVNGVRNDNRPENLELWASVQPAGQRVADLVEHARYILSLYGSEVGL